MVSEYPRSELFCSGFEILLQGIWEYFTLELFIQKIRILNKLRRELFEQIQIGLWIGDILGII